MASSQFCQTPCGMMMRIGQQQQPQQLACRSSTPSSSSCGRRRQQQQWAPAAAPRSAAAACVPFQQQQHHHHHHHHHHQQLPHPPPSSRGQHCGKLRAGPIDAAPAWTLDQLAGLAFGVVMLAFYFGSTQVDVVIARQQRRQLGLCEACGGLNDPASCSQAGCPMRAAGGSSSSSGGGGGGGGA